MLLDRHVRLLTLTGAPGTGKTRLALALAEAVRDEFLRGVWFLPLGALQNPDLVLPSIAQALGIRQVGRRPLTESLIMALRDRSLLLVMDNFEHLRPARAAVVELLGAC